MLSMNISPGDLNRFTLTSLVWESTLMSFGDVESYLMQ